SSSPRTLRFSGVSSTISIVDWLLSAICLSSRSVAGRIWPDYRREPGILLLAKGRWTLALRAYDAMVGSEPPFVDFAGGDGRAQHAVRLPVVLAVAEAALAEVGAEFAEGVFDFLAVEMAETELLQAGRVDQLAFAIEVVERGVGRGVLAGIEGLRDFAGRGIGFRDQGIDQGRLAHAGLADQHAGYAIEFGAQVVGMLEGRQLDDTVAEAGEDGQPLAGGRQLVGQ